MNAKILVLLFCINLISAKPINVTEDLNETISKSYDIENDSTTTEQMTTTPLKTTTTTQSTTSTTQKAQETTAAINSGCENHNCNQNQVCVPYASGYGYQCNCLPGYSGLDCKRYDACHNVICQNNGSSSSFSKTCICACLSGFSGKFCENKMELTTTEPFEETTEGEPEPEELDFDRRDIDSVKIEEDIKEPNSGGKFNSSNCLITFLASLVIMVSCY